MTELGNWKVHQHRGNHVTTGDEQGPERRVRALCLGCGGQGFVNRPRLFVSLATGETSTVIEPGRCLFCRDDPGYQSGPGFQPPV